MLYESIAVRYFIQNNFEVISAGHTILQCFADAICFLEKLLESVGLTESRGIMSLHTFKVQLHSTFLGYESLKTRSNRTH